MTKIVASILNIFACLLALYWYFMGDYAHATWFVTLIILMEVTIFKGDKE